MARTPEAVLSFVREEKKPGTGLFASMSRGKKQSNRQRTAFLI
jgi:hypothetical protein